MKGTFIAAIGSYTLSLRELDDVAIARSSIVADDPEEVGEIYVVPETYSFDIEQVLRTSGDFVSKPHIKCSLGSLLLKNNTSDFANADVILFKSIGSSVQDLFIAKLALRCVKDGGVELKL
jgi:ornithine cyclodeaminase/alanine dehydrogenase-like protein (mu-crystallin family)